MTNKHSTYTLILICILIFTGAVIALLESSDIDEVCNNNNAILKRLTGTWNCSITHYGELFIQNDTVVDIPNDMIHYPIDNMSISNSVGITMNESNMTIVKSSTYHLEFDGAFSGGGNTEYEIHAFLNSTILEDCSLHRKMGQGGDVGSASFGCIRTLNTGDIITIQVEDLTNPSQDITFHSANFRIMEVQ